MRNILLIIGLTLLPLQAFTQETDRPNIILVMADDMGWGDTGYNGHPTIQTPNLDAMAESGIRFNRFYSGSAVCSPTRGSCLTGRHPYRYGITGANKGHMLPEERTLAEILKQMGYRTGHFGKWHLGTLTKTVRDSNRGGQEKYIDNYSPPWENGFERCFSTEAKIPTYDPMLTPIGWSKNKDPKKPFGTYFWDETGKRITDNLEGDASRIVMDRAIPFIREAAQDKKPFFTVIWFHAPHLPVVAGPKHRALYAEHPEEAQHYFGCITALDEQMGRLRKELRTLGIADNTMLWFTSDNGPEGKNDLPTNGSAGPFRGRKRSLHEGGVRVPGLLEWPAQYPNPQVIDMPASTSDYYPTIMDAISLVNLDSYRIDDGESLFPVLNGETKRRSRPIGFAHNQQFSLVDNRYKLITKDLGKTYQLYDLIEDPGETNDLAKKSPAVKFAKLKELNKWRLSLTQTRRVEELAPPSAPVFPAPAPLQTQTKP